MNELNNLIDIEVDEIATAHPNYFQANIYSQRTLIWNINI
jgi:hypothetical protein